MASIRVALKTWASDQDGRHLVLLGIEADGRTRYISLNIKVRKTQWSKKNHRVLASTHPNARDLNAEIEKKLTDARRVLSKMKYDEATLTVDTIKEAITAGHSRGDFWAYADNWLEQKRRKEQIYYWRRCRSILRKFKEFSESPLQWNRISVTLLRDFDLFLDETKGNSANTRRDAFRGLRTIIRDAVRESVINPQDNPFYRFKLPRAEQPHRARLTLDEISRIEALNLSEWSHEIIARDMYIMAFRMRGARFGDVVRLTSSSIVDGRINYKARKTGDSVSVPVSTEIQTILDKYVLDEDADTFIFPPLRKRRFPNTEAEVSFVSGVSAWINKSLKIVAEKAGISKRVTFHTARHSFASISDQMGIGHAAIQSALKHKSRATTDIYLASLTDTSLDETFEAVYKSDK